VGGGGGKGEALPRGEENGGSGVGMLPAAEPMGDAEAQPGGDGVPEAEAHALKHPEGGG
jgi:hypothetical protein